LDLFANVVHVTSLPGCETKHKDLDIVIIRESTEGEYSCLEHEVFLLVFCYWFGIKQNFWHTYKKWYSSNLWNFLWYFRYGITSE